MVAGVQSNILPPVVFGWAKSKIPENSVIPKNLKISPNVVLVLEMMCAKFQLNRSKTLQTVTIPWLTRGQTEKNETLLPFFQKKMPLLLHKRENVAF
jgi:hypothetical protein